MADFMRALAGAIQVKGGFYEPQAQAHAIEDMVVRLEQGLTRCRNSARPNWRRGRCAKARSAWS